MEDKSSLNCIPILAYVTGNDLRASKLSLELLAKPIEKTFKNDSIEKHSFDNFFEFLKHKGLDLCLFDSLEKNIEKFIYTQHPLDSIEDNNHQIFDPCLTNKSSTSISISISMIFPKFVKKFTDDYFSNGNLFAVYGQGFGILNKDKCSIYLNDHSCQYYLVSDNLIFLRIPTSLHLSGIYLIKIYTFEIKGVLQNCLTENLN